MSILKSIILKEDIDDVRKLKQIYKDGAKKEVPIQTALGSTLGGVIGSGVGNIAGRIIGKRKAKNIEDPEEKAKTIKKAKRISTLAGGTIGALAGGITRNKWIKNYLKKDFKDEANKKLYQKKTFDIGMRI